MEKETNYDRVDFSNVKIRVKARFLRRYSQGMFNFNGSNMFFFVLFSRTLYSLSVPGKQEQAELHAVLRTEIMRKGTCLDYFQ